MINDWLRKLIRDSGNAGTSGQTFLGHVAGAASGAEAVQYLLTGWSNWQSPNYSSATSYAYNAVIDFTFDFDAGSRWFNIRGLFDLMTAFVDVPADPGSYGEVAIVGGAFASAPTITGNSLSLRLRGALTKRTIASWAGSFGYTDGANEFTDPSFPVEMYADFSPTYNPASPSYHTFPVTVQYGPREFNSTPLTHTFNVTVMGTTGFNSYDIEWYSDSGLTTLVATGTTRVTIPDVSNAGTNYGQFWIRYREENGLWNTYNLHWWDRRSYGSDPN